MGIVFLALVSYVCIRYGVLPMLERLIDIVYPDDQDIARDRYAPIMKRMNVAGDYLFVILNKSRDRFGMHRF